MVRLAQFVSYNAHFRRFSCAVAFSSATSVSGHVLADDASFQELEHADLQPGFRTPAEHLLDEGPRALQIERQTSEADTNAARVGRPDSHSRDASLIDYGRAIGIWFEPTANNAIGMDGRDQVTNFYFDSNQAQPPAGSSVPGETVVQTTIPAIFAVAAIGAVFALLLVRRRARRRSA